MKTRNDFVSNSSSCSFILSADARLADAVRFFAKVFGEDHIPYRIRDDVTVECYVKNKWLREVKSKLDPEYDDSEWKEDYRDWRTGQYVKKDPEEVSWDSVRIEFDDFVKLASDEQTLEKIDRLQFRCEDSDFMGLFFLRLLYAFFERNEMCPDCSDSEHYFIRTGSDDEKFIMKLASVCGGGKKSESKQKGNLR